MPLIKVCLLPHSPLLIPEIGKTNHNFLDKTLIAYKKIKEDLSTLKIETVIVISPHNQIGDDFFVINSAPEMELSFPDFGFIPQKNFLKGDILLSDIIKNQLKNDLPLRSISENKLDYGSAIPLYLLKTPETSFKILTISPAEKLELKEHFAGGEKLAQIIEASNKRIALIISGDLSHRLKRKSPGGYSPKGAKFDNKLIEYLSEPETAKENILNMDKKLISEASECGLKPIVMAIGILNKLTWESHILAYQTDFGIGYLSLEFILKKEIKKTNISENSNSI